MANQELHYINPGPVQTRPDQFRPGQTSSAQTRPDRTRPNWIGPCLLTGRSYKTAHKRGDTNRRIAAMLVDCRQSTRHKTNKPTLVAVAVMIGGERRRGSTTHRLMIPQWYSPFWDPGISQKGPGVQTQWRCAGDSTGPAGGPFCQ